MNKKIASEIAIGSILILVIVIGGIFWMQNRQFKTMQNELDSLRQINSKKLLTPIQVQQTQPLQETNTSVESPLSAAEPSKPVSVPTPTEKLVMCMNKCGSGTPVAQDMTRFLGETVQKIRACFGDISKKCPSQDVTNEANWTSSNEQVAYWTKDLIYPQKSFNGVYPKKTLISENVGTSIMKVEYKGYSYSVNLNTKEVGN